MKNLLFAIWVILRVMVDDDNDINDKKMYVRYLGLNRTVAKAERGAGGRKS